MPSVTAAVREERSDPRGLAFRALCFFVGTLLAMVYLFLKP